MTCIQRAHTCARNGTAGLAIIRPKHRARALEHRTPLKNSVRLKWEEGDNDDGGTSSEDGLVPVVAPALACPVLLSLLPPAEPEDAPKKCAAVWNASEGPALAFHAASEMP